MNLLFLPLSVALSVSCSQSHSTPSAPPSTKPSPPLEVGQSEAVFAGGCFWCMEKPFDAVEGVVSTTSGYSGGKIEGPSYQQVASHQTEHLEVLRIVYDSSKVDYAKLLDVFWHNIDPTQSDGQFCDKGHQYTSAIFYSSEAEKALATAAREKIAAQLGEEVATDIRPASVFWEAEGYHQDFYKTNPQRYYSYRKGCGRDKRLEALWGGSQH
jgi:peptide-methionine (S)-S-oxide reductase